VRLPDGLVPRRAVVLRPRGLGDVVLSSAVIDALARAWPGTALDYVAEAPARALLEPDARLAGIFLLGPRGAREGRVQEGGKIAAVAWLRARRPDVVLDLFSNPRTALLAWLSGARWRVGYDRSARRLAYNVRIPRFRGSAAEDRRWAGEVQLDFLRDAGIRWSGEAKGGVALTAADRDAADAALARLGYAAADRFAAVLPGGSWEGKRWSIAGYVAAGRALADRLGRPALVLWGPPERADAARIAEGLGAEGRLAPPTTLRVMAALAGRASLVVAADSLGRHLAIVQGVPTVGVFGSTDPKDWTPPGGPHRVVRAAPPDGLRDLPAGPVVREIDALLVGGVLDTPRGDP
jgi:ADP-heptose:LPS heptosyltransferase